MLDRRIVFIEYVSLVVVGLGIALVVGQLFFYTSVIFVVCGVLYNVPPIRLKDKPYLDVLSESINNPIRLVLGWSMVTQSTVPPLSVIISYWFGGAFLMAIKRLAEYRFIAKRPGGVEELRSYRASFRGYTEESILLSAILYQSLAVFFGAVFLVKYRAEYILLFPSLALLIAYYLKLGLSEESITQTPENLHKDVGLMLIVASIVVLFFISTFVDITFLQWVVNSEYGALHIFN